MESEKESLDVKSISNTANKILSEIGKVIVGKKNIVRDILIALLCEGHILLEGVPGVAKTELAKSFAKTLGGTFKRIQFTPDLLPSDIVGTVVYDQKKGVFYIRRGPIFTNILLADEINRAPPKCVSPDTPILLGNGEIKSIKQLYWKSDGQEVKISHNEWIKKPKTPVYVLSINPFTLKIVKKPVKYFYRKQSDDPFYIIVTNSGKRLTCSPNHMFFVLDKEKNLKETKARYIREGDVILIPGKIKFSRLRKQSKRRMLNAHLRYSSYMEQSVCEVLNIKTNVYELPLIFLNTDTEAGVYSKTKQSVSPLQPTGAYVKRISIKNRVIACSTTIKDVSHEVKRRIETKNILDPLKDTVYLKLLSNSLLKCHVELKLRNNEEIFIETADKWTANKVAYALQIMGLSPTITVKKIAVRNTELEVYRVKCNAKEKPSMLPYKFESVKKVYIKENNAKELYDISVDGAPQTYICGWFGGICTHNTQAALLEAMQEKQVTIEGKTHCLEEPFMVLATQNPLEQEGSLILDEYLIYNNQIYNGHQLLKLAEREGRIIQSNENGVIYELPGAKTYSVNQYSLDCAYKDASVYYINYDGVVYKVKTQRGEITITEEHPFLVNRNGHIMWIRARNLDPKTDFIVTLSNLSSNNFNHSKEDSERSRAKLTPLIVDFFKTGCANIKNSDKEWIMKSIFTLPPAIIEEAVKQALKQCSSYKPRKLTIELREKDLAILFTYLFLRIGIVVSSEVSDGKILLRMNTEKLASLANQRKRSFEGNDHLIPVSVKDLLFMVRFIRKCKAQSPVYESVRQKLKMQLKGETPVTLLPHYMVKLLVNHCKKLVRDISTAANNMHILQNYNPVTSAIHYQNIVNTPHLISAVKKIIKKLENLVKPHIFYDKVLGISKYNYTGKVFGLVVPHNRNYIGGINAAVNHNTYPLPEAQIDRFFFRIIVDYPTDHEEIEVLVRKHIEVREEVQQITTPEQIIAMREAIKKIYVDPSIIAYIRDIIVKTRRDPQILLGGSPRASLALLGGAKARAAIMGRDYVIPDDIKAIAVNVLNHRLILKPEVELEGISVYHVINRILEETNVPD